MRARVLAVALLGLLGEWVGGCVDSEFLRGAECTNDRDCGRSLTCEQRVCGGCPPEIPLDDGRCTCPGDRVLDCRLFVAADPPCMPVCRSADELCKVAEVRNDGSTEELRRCDDTPPGERCFDVLFGPSNDCPNGQARIELPEGPAVDLVVNCPPPESDESHFDCEPP